MKAISVIIPSYKPGDYLQECLKSLVAQTLRRELFEVWIVLNGCKEPFLSDINAFLTTLPLDFDVHLLQTDAPGVSNARNLGIESATGEYVCFIDDDDWVSPNFLEELFAKADPSVVVNANILSVNIDKGQTTKDPLYDYNQFMGQEQTSMLRVRRLLSSACFKLIPMAVVGKRKFDTKYALGEDALFMASLTDRIRTIRFTPEDAVYYRRIRLGSAMRHHRTLRQRAENCFGLYGSYLGIYLSNPLHYNLLFFLNRLAAVSKWWFRY